MIKNWVYEQEIERISPKLEKLKNRSFDEIINGLYNELFQSSIPRALIFALTYILDPSRFYIEVNHNGVSYTVKFTSDPHLTGFGHFVYRDTRSGKRPTDKEARDFIKKFLVEDLGVEGLIGKAKEVVNTCKVIQGS